MLTSRGCDASLGHGKDERFLVSAGRKTVACIVFPRRRFGLRKRQF